MRWIHSHCQFGSLPLHVQVARLIGRNLEVLRSETGSNQDCEGEEQIIWFENAEDQRGKPTQAGVGLTIALLWTSGWVEQTADTIV